MNNDDEDRIQEAEVALHSANVVKMNSNTISPTLNVNTEIESSLTYLLKHRITKIQNDIAFEDQIKEAILSRLAEADFSELSRILSMIQSNTNSAVEKVLLPFISRGDRIPLLDTKDKEANPEAGELAFKNAPKEVLEALLDLTRFIETNKLSPGAGASRAEEGKENP